MSPIDRLIDNTAEVVTTYWFKEQIRDPLAKFYLYHRPWSPADGNCRAILPIVAADNPDPMGTHDPRPLRPELGLCQGQSVGFLAGEPHAVPQPKPSRLEHGDRGNPCMRPADKPAPFPVSSGST